MKRFTAIAVLLAACSNEAEQSNASISVDPQMAGVFAGEGRDRLCIKRSGEGWNVGIVAYGAGDANCTLKGRVVEAQDHASLVEAIGDPACRFTIESGAELGLPPQLPAACDYYCGPGATLAGKTFQRDPNASPAVDFAGDPLC